MAVMLSVTQRQKIRVILALIPLACYHNSIRVRTYLLQASLLPHHRSPWQKLYNAGDESSFLHITGLTREVFGALLHVIIPPGHVICHPRWGRPWSLPPDGMLGLLLCSWAARCQISGFVWFLVLLHRLAHASWKWSYGLQCSGCDIIRLRE